MQGKRKKSRRSGQNAEKAIYGKDLSFAAAEAYKLLRTNILFALPDEKKCTANVELIMQQDGGAVR